MEIQNKLMLMNQEELKYERKIFVQLTKKEQINLIKRKLDLTLKQCEESVKRLQRKEL